MLKLGIIGNYHSDFQKTVPDGKRQRVEQRLNEFVVTLEAQAVRRKRHEENLEQQHRLWEKQKRRRRNSEERRRKDIERLIALKEETRTRAAFVRRTRNPG